MSGDSSYAGLLGMEDGTALGNSDWHRVTQEDINAFGRLTKDEDPYHVDSDWARENSVLGTPISFGFLTMSYLTYFLHQALGKLGIASDDTQLFNFGFNRVRLPEPVPVDAEIRGNFTFAGARVRDSGGVEVTVNATVEIRGNERPALVADWLFVAMTDY